MTNPSQPLRLIALLIAALAVSMVSAQSADAQIRVGGGVVYTDIDPWNLGLQGNGYFALPNLPQLRIGGDFTYYLPESEGINVPGVGNARVEQGLLALNGNAQFHFLTQEQFSLYALGGVNWTRVSISASSDLPEIPTGEESEARVGANLGGGGELNLGFGVLYGEAKSILAGEDWSRIVLGAGIRIGAW